MVTTTISFLLLYVPRYLGFLFFLVTIGNGTESDGKFKIVVLSAKQEVKENLPNGTLDRVTTRS